MKAFRVFNNVDVVHVEWTVRGVRFRLPSRILMGAAMFTGAFIAWAWSPWAGVPIGLALSLAVMHLVREINVMDPVGQFREFTVLGMLFRTALRPVINNTGRR